MEIVYVGKNFSRCVNSRSGQSRSTNNIYTGLDEHDASWDYPWTKPLKACRYAMRKGSPSKALSSIELDLSS